MRPARLSVMLYEGASPWWWEPTGARAGLRQLGGDLIVIGRAGPMAGERQSGGRLLTHADLGPHAGRGRSWGRFIRMDVGGGVLGDAGGPRRDGLGVLGLRSMARPGLRTICTP